jgi:hypothetical protein
VDVAYLLVAELAVAKPADSVVFVQPLLRLGRALDVPLQKRHAQCARYLFGQHRLAGTRLALDKQGALQGDGRIDGQHQVLRGNVLVRALELHRGYPLASRQWRPRVVWVSERVEISISRSL